MSDLPIIPDAEFEQRKNAMQEWMAREAIDVIVANANDRSATGQAHVRYLTDFAAHFEPICCLVPSSGEVVLVVGPESENLARVTARAGRIVIAEEYAYPEEDYPWAKISNLKAIMKDIERSLNGSVKKVGIVGKEKMEASVHDALKNDYELVSADHIMNKMRAIKSENEIKVMEYTYKMAEAGMAAALRTLRNGVREVEVAAEAEYTMRKMGSEGTGLDTMVACGADRTRPIIVRAGLERIRANELILVTIIPKYQGYHSAIGRPVSIGKPSDEIMEAAQLALEAQQKIAENLKPGILGRELENRGREVMAQKKLDRYFAYIGLHSVGLIEFESPIFFSRSNDTIRENMILSVDIPCFLAPWGGFRVEDGYRIDREGGIPLDSTEKGLIIL